MTPENIKLTVELKWRGRVLYVGRLFLASYRQTLQEEKEHMFAIYTYNGFCCFCKTEQEAVDAVVKLAKESLA